jgi:hypothetical protein
LRSTLPLSWVKRQVSWFCTRSSGLRYPYFQQTIHSSNCFLIWHTNPLKASYCFLHFHR